MKHLDNALGYAGRTLVYLFVLALKSIFWLPVLTVRIYDGDVDERERERYAWGVGLVWVMMLLLLALLLQHPDARAVSWILPSLFYFGFGAMIHLVMSRDREMADTSVRSDA